MVGSAISISVAPATAVLGRRYYDLEGSLALMRWLWQSGAVDGVEVQNLEARQVLRAAQNGGSRRKILMSGAIRY